MFLDPPKAVKISGSISVKHDEEEAVYSCKTSESFPEPHIIWKKLVDGKMEAIKEEKTVIEKIESNAGVSKTSTITLHPRDLRQNSMLLFCIAQVPVLKFEKSSEFLEVMITCKSQKN